MAVIIPDELICLEVISTTDMLGVPVNPCALVARVALPALPDTLPVTLPTKDEAVIDPLVFIFCVMALDVSSTIKSPDIMGKTTDGLPEYSECGADFNLV